MIPDNAGVEGTLYWKERARKELLAYLKRWRKKWPHDRIKVLVRPYYTGKNWFAHVSVNGLKRYLHFRLDRWNPQGRWKT